MTGEAQPFEVAVLDVGGKAVTLVEQPLRAAYQHPALSNGQDHREYVVPVSWQQTRPRSEAYWAKGMFANQNSACKLRNRFTLEQLALAFDLEE